LATNWKLTVSPGSMLRLRFWPPMSKPWVASGRRLDVGDVPGDIVALLEIHMLGRQVRAHRSHEDRHVVAVALDALLAGLGGEFRWRLGIGSQPTSG
jgi:hypothetical protein